MVIRESLRLESRQHASVFLAEKLSAFKNSNAVVIGIPYGGAVVGFHLSKELRLKFDVIACRAIAHPGNTRKSIGSISASEVIIHDDGHDIPRDYIYHQIIQNRNAMNIRQEFYRSGEHGYNLKNIDVIIVGDTIVKADAVVAAVKAIRNQSPRKIILATALIAPEAVAQLAGEVDEIISLAIVEDVALDFYEDNTIVRDEDIRDMVAASRV